MDGQMDCTASPAQQLAAPPWEMFPKRWEYPGIPLREQGLAVSQGCLERREQVQDWGHFGSQWWGSAWLITFCT